MNPKIKLVAWLRDAHAIERAVEKTLETQSHAAKQYPELAQRLRSHAAQSHEHASRVENLLKSLNAIPSAAENAVGKILGSMQAAAGLFLGDPIVTNTAAAYALEHLEIATYVAVVAAAEAAGEPDAAAVCREIIKEEEGMAHWLRDYLPVLTVKYLAPGNGRP
jgi:ferritin-like metal-binding protein YciE